MKGSENGETMKAFFFVLKSPEKEFKKILRKSSKFPKSWFAEIYKNNRSYENTDYPAVAMTIKAQPLFSFLQTSC